MTKMQKTAREIIEQYDGPPVRVMEVCGTHTHEIFRLGVRKILPKQVELISGPGCPVCVTPAEFIDETIWLALEKGVISAMDMTSEAAFTKLMWVLGHTKNLDEVRKMMGTCYVGEFTEKK